MGCSCAAKFLWQVVVRRSAPPFVFVAGDGKSLEDYTGITPMFLEVGFKTRRPQGHRRRVFSCLCGKFCQLLLERRFRNRRRTVCFGFCRIFFPLRPPADLREAVDSTVRLVSMLWLRCDYFVRVHEVLDASTPLVPAWRCVKMI